MTDVAERSHVNVMLGGSVRRMTTVPERDGSEFLGVSGLQRKAARTTAQSILYINIVLLTINAVVTLVFCLSAVREHDAAVAVGILFAGIFAALLTWVSLQWFRHTLLLLADISLHTDLALSD
jgi:protein-S-isoprenylcysteine O-methyltransferase Ste14